MKQVTIRLKGIVPLLTHNNQMSDPLNPYNKAIKPYAGKRNKTDKDHAILGRIEWESGLYLHDGTVQLPLRVLDACFWGGAKKTKNGVKYKSGVFLEGDNFPLKYTGATIKTNGSKKIPNPELDKFFDRHHFRTMVRIDRRAIPRVRPIFHDWSIDNIILSFDNEVIDIESVLTLVSDAGAYVGFCEMRPRLGRFELEQV